MVSFKKYSVVNNNIFFYILSVGDPNIVGRDGSVPIMVLLVPLINKDHLHHFTHSMKVSFLRLSAHTEI